MSKVITLVYTEEICTDEVLITDQDFIDAQNLAKAMVFQYQQLGWTQFSREELISAAYEGICEAAIRFDPYKGSVKRTKFSSYAYFYIKKFIGEYIAKNKTILSGSLSECYKGEVGYAASIDAYAAMDNTGGIDHLACLATNEQSVEDTLTNEYVQQQIRDLLAEMLGSLTQFERTVYMLSTGIGTCYNQELSVRDIAIAMECSIGKAYAGLREANKKIDEVKLTYATKFDQLHAMLA